ncbi:MAG: GEVED domain-containing protein [Planctomycetota bacterium]
MRIRLPGEIGTRNTYHVRVRSSNTPDPTDFATLTDPALVGDGLTRGRYQMQIRIRETDESAGTQIRFADVRFATTAVQVIGQPLHSPLLGEEGETTLDNSTATLAQRLGVFGEDADGTGDADPLQSDRLAKSIAGTISDTTDVDFYQFEITYEDVPAGAGTLPLSTIIDLDYASNFARSDMALYLFDATGDLIYTATDSNVAGDLPSTETGNSASDLSRGSAGNADPFLGSVELLQGTYFLAVSNQTQVPLSLDQFFNPASNNPLVRLQPIAATERVAVDNAANGVLFDNSSIVPYSLDDVVLYVNTPTGLHVVNPFTGQNYGQIGDFGGEDIHDVAFRANGELYAYTGFADRQRSDTDYFYVQIDTGDASLDQVATGAGITTFGDLVVEQNSPQILDFTVNEGLFIEAITIREYKDVERGLFVGSRNPGAAAGLQYTQNILYEFSPTTGQAIGPDFNLFLTNSGAGTIPREIGRIDTAAPANPLSTQLGVTDVLEYTSAGVLTQRLFDGDVFTLTSGMDTTVFELDFGGDVLITGAPVLDGDTLVIGGTTFEFDTGSRLVLSNVNANGGLDTGQSVTVQGPTGGFERFEFVNQQGDDPNNPASIPIPLRFNDGQARSASAIANDLALAIVREIPETEASVLGNEITFRNGTTFQTFGAGVRSAGNDGVAFGNLAIDVDEVSTSEEVLTAIVDALTNNGIPVNTNGLTFNVPGAASVSVNSQGLVGGGAAGVTVGRTPIVLDLDDSARDVADKIAVAINNLGGTATATARNRSVAIGGGFITSVSGNLVAGGIPNGGTITGTEFVGNDLYAISDNGSLFRVTDGELTAGTNQFINGARTIGSYVTTATDLLRLNEDFTGLRAGPNSVDGGAYSNVLFGITSSGNIYAFNTAGELLPYFAGGVSMISTGIPNAQGLDFSTLDYNLWHFTNTRGGDLGHGETGTDSRSLSFSYEGLFQSNYSDPVEFPTATARRDGQGVNNTFNFPGGAKGQIQSRTFSLENYAPSDLPTLYFNYLIEADGGGSTDALRVYVVEPDGTEHAVALNTTQRNAGFTDDEFDDPPQVAPYNDTIDVDKQQLFDNTDTWRQARVPLGDFAGMPDLSLRIEFATAGSFSTGGTSIRTVAGSELVEGETIRVSGHAFTVDFPPTLITPEGSDLVAAYSSSLAARAEFTLDGQVYVLNDGTRTINAGEIEIDLTAGLGGGLTVGDLSAAEISAIIVAAVNANPPVVMTYNLVDDGNSVEFGEAMTLTSPSTLFTVRNTTVTSGNTIDVRAGMSASAVAAAFRTALLDQFFPNRTAGSPDFFPLNGSLISLPGFSVGDAGPFINASSRYADSFGSSTVAGARNNDFEGIFLDDFIIGFAERGEQVVDVRPAGSGLDTTFVTDQRFAFPQPDDPRSSLVTGAYQVEIRDGSEYVSDGFLQFRTFDSNARLDDGIQITARPASELSDGDTFSITDGRATVEFEFDSDDSVTPGRVPIPFSLGVLDDDTGLLRAQNSTEVAAAIIEAINRSDVQSVLEVDAVPGSGFQNEAPFQLGIKRIERLDPTINLVGNVVIDDAGGSLDSVVQFDHRGDSNRERDGHGVIVIENSRFLLNEQFGIDIQHDISAEVAGTDGPSVVRYPRNLVELNVDNYTPGVVVQSNVLAFNGAGGLQLKGIAGDLDQTDYDPVGVERIVNNTIIGGTITPGINSPSGTFEGILFDQGNISFADQVVLYDPNAGGSPPTLIHQVPDSALGAPDSTGRGAEPIDGQTAVSLGIEGSLTVQFTDNFLTGSGDNRGDLVIFEVGEVESVRVEISRDGITFFDVGNVGGLTNQIDIDAFGFGPNDRFAFVRVTDERQGDNTGTSIGADIDAIGAISSVPVDTYNPGGIGVSISGNASPFLLNNIIANSETGVEVSNTNPGFVSGGNSYFQNTADTSTGVSLGQISQVLTAAEAVFVNPTDLVFAPASGARIIDSSIDSLPDRDNITTVRAAIGISPSPILAPNVDVNGQLRVDDPNVEPPSGLGDQVFKDRGAFDRGDLSGPRVTLLSPYAPGIGLDSGRATVRGAAPQAFEIQLVDGLPPADFVPGTGIDDGSVSSGSLILFRDGQPLVEGTDYRFGYNPSTNTIRLTPIAGVWEDDSTYVIRMVDSSDAIIRAGEGNVYEDGATLTVVDNLNQPTTFEYETGLIVDLFPGLTGAAADGIRLDVFDGNVTRSYELDVNNAILPISTRVPITEAGTTADFVAAFAEVINADSQLNMTAFARDETLQLLGGTPLASVTSPSGAVQVAGAIGTSTGFGFQIPAIDGTSQADVFDGQSIRVNLGASTSIDFELDTDGLLINDEATAVSISSTASLDEVANALVLAIGGSPLGLAPTNAGFGRVFLGGDNTYSIDLSNSTATQIGLAGEGPTVPILIPIDQTAEEVVQIIQGVIDGQNLPGVSTSIVDTRIFLEGSGGVIGFGAVETVVVQDEVGNLLQSNQADGQTELIIFIGTGFDYGDATSPYTSSIDDGGPRHRVDPEFTLGAGISADSDAEIPNADNFDDGVTLPSTFQVGFSRSVGLTLNNADGRTAYVDAWFDWDQDGVFEADERFSFGTVGTGRTTIADGGNSVLIDVPNDAVPGQTVARFRLSESAVIGPNGDGGFGEVEDYPIVVTANPFTNPSNRFDTNGSGTVTPLDALVIINALARRGEASINLETDPVSTPQFPDVNGDGRLSPSDALAVINELSRIINGEGEGEFTGRFLSAGPGVLASGSTVVGDMLIPGLLGVSSQDDSDDASSSDEGVSTLGGEASSKVSVFDSAASMQLDSIVDCLAEDKVDVSDSSADADEPETSDLDAFFAGL